MRSSFYHTVVYAKIAFLLALYLFNKSTILLRFLLKPSKFLKKLFTSFFGYSIYVTGRSVLLASSYTSLFISVLKGLLLILLSLSLPLLISTAFLPGLLFEFSLACTAYLFYGLVLGPLFYVYSLLFFFISHFSVLVVYAALVLQRTLQALLGLAGGALNFVLFLFEFVPLVVGAFLGERRSPLARPSVLTMLFTGFSDHHFGDFSVFQIREAGRVGRFFDLDPYFYTGLGQTLTVEAIQHQEGADFEETPVELRAPSMDAVRFRQVFKTTRVSGVPLVDHVCYESAKNILKLLPGTQERLDRFLKANADYRKVWAQKDFYSPTPRRHHSYVFSRYLKPAFRSSLDYRHFIAPFVLPNARLFREVGLYYPRRVSHWFTPGPLSELLYSYNNDSISRFSLFSEEIRPYDTLDGGRAALDEYGLSTSDDIVLAGFHHAQLVDDRGVFRRYYLYNKPWKNRYWFKRFVEDRVMDFRIEGRSILSSRQFSQFGSLVVWFVVFFRNLGAAVVEFLKTLVERIFVISFTGALLSAPFIGRALVGLKEDFFKLVNSIVFHRRAKALAERRGQFSVFDRLGLVADSCLLKGLLMAELLNRTAFIGLVVALRPFNYLSAFIRFLTIQLKAGRLLTLLENEADIWISASKKTVSSRLSRAYNFLFNRKR